MTSARNLGPILAIAGAALIGFAVVAGFLVTGGPGDARNLRLDELTLDRVAASVRTAQCAYFANGEAPEAIQNVSMNFTELPRGLPIVCRGNEGAFRNDARTGAGLSGPGDVTYQKLDADSIRVCAHFRLPDPPTGRARNPVGQGDVFALFPTLRADRSAGEHCFDLRLKPMPAK